MTAHSLYPIEAMSDESFQKLTLEQLRELREAIDALKTTVHDQHTVMSVELAQTKMRASFLGVIAGALPAIAVLIYTLLK